MAATVWRAPSQMRRSSPSRMSAGKEGASWVLLRDCRICTWETTMLCSTASCLSSLLTFLLVRASSGFWLRLSTLHSFIIRLKALCIFWISSSISRDIYPFNCTIPHATGELQRILLVVLVLLLDSRGALPTMADSADSAPPRPDRWSVADVREISR